MCALLFLFLTFMFLTDAVKYCILVCTLHLVFFIMCTVQVLVPHRTYLDGARVTFTLVKHISV